MASFTNMATLSYNGNTVNSNVVTGEIQQTLTATKTAVRPDYAAGGVVTYVVNLKNSGPTALNNLTLSDNLGQITPNTTPVYPLTYTAGSVRYFVNGVLQTAPTVNTTQPLQITGISVPAGGTATLVYETTANAYAPLAAGSTVVNTVTVTGDGVATPVTAEETVTVRSEPALTITKALSPTVVTENGQITYTFTIVNTGNTEATAADGIVLSDLFSPAITIQSVTYNGAAWTSPDNYTYDSGSGQFTTVAGQITVPAATYTQNSDGSYSTTPRTSTLVVVGTV